MSLHLDNLPSGKYNVKKLLLYGGKIMAALGVITLVLTSFTFVYYAYLANHSERDVSFFMGVSLISLVLNLCTNASHFFGIAFLYLAIAVIFLGVGFAVDTDESVGFYTSIGPWCVKTFTNTAFIGWQVLSFVLFPAGIALYFVWNKSKPELAKACGRAGMFGLVLCGLLLWAILGLAL